MIIRVDESAFFMTALVVLAVLVGLVPARMARRKGWSFRWWWLYGALPFPIALVHAYCVRPNQIVVTEPADFSWKGQPVVVEYALSAEMWQFFAFIFGALLTIGFAVADELMPAGWCRLTIKGVWALMIGYGTLWSYPCREGLSRALPRFKKQVAR